MGGRVVLHDRRKWVEGGTLWSVGLGVVGLREEVYRGTRWSVRDLFPADSSGPGRVGWDDTVPDRVRNHATAVDGDGRGLVEGSYSDRDLPLTHTDGRGHSRSGP